MTDDILTVSGRQAEAAEITSAELRERMVTALATILCKHGRTQTFALLVRDVLELIEYGDGRTCPPMLIVADPSPEQVAACREDGVSCPPPPRLLGGMRVSGLTDSWERRIRKLIKLADPLANDSRRVVEATWQSGVKSGSGYWSLLLDCGHVVRKRARDRKKVPRYTRCRHCSGAKQESK